jgi:hypothetical protein
MPLGFGPAKYQIEYTSGLVHIFTTLIPEFIAEFFRFNPVFTATIENNIFTLSFINGLLSFLFFISLGYFLKITWNKNLNIRINIYYIFIFSLGFCLITQLIFFREEIIHLRYYMFMFVIFALISSYAYDDMNKNNKLLKNIFLCLLVVFMVTNSIYNLSQLNLVKIKNSSLITVWNWKKITSILENHGIELAYAMCWDSNSITVLSNGKVEISPVLGDMTPMEYVVPYRNYSPEIKNHKTAFIRINQPIYDDFQYLPQFHISNFDIFEKAVEKIRFMGTFYPIEILIFDKNYFTFPDGHDPKIEYLKQLKNYYKQFENIRDFKE